MVPAAAGSTSWRKLSERATPASIVVLSVVVDLLEGAVTSCGAYKVETIGSEFMAVSGLPAACPQHHNTAHAMMRTAVKMIECLGAAGMDDVRAVHARACVDAMRTDRAGVRRR